MDLFSESRPINSVFCVSIGIVYKIMDWQRSKHFSRRDFLLSSVLAGGGLVLPISTTAQNSVPMPMGTPAAPASDPGEAADVTLRIGPVLVDVAKHKTISTIGYNGQVPGPLITLQEGKQISVRVFNDTDTPEFVHWHGQLIPSEVDGSGEERSVVVPPRGQVNYQLTPRPSGIRWVHTHVMAGSDLYRGLYTGQFGIVYIESKEEKGAFDQEVFLATHEFNPYYTGGEMEEEGGKPEDSSLEAEVQAAKDQKPNGWEVGYETFTINGRCLGFGDPIRVKEGRRVMFRILNASATETIELALSGHEFYVVALDGNPVPRPNRVKTLQLGAAERIDAIVEMRNPGVWILGTPKDDDRKRGMGIVVEYANRKGKAQWHSPGKSDWNFLLFDSPKSMPQPDQVIPMEIGKINGGKGSFNIWTINGQPYEQSEPIKVEKGRRYRLAFVNKSDDLHPLHLHRHNFEITKIHGKETAGIIKDTILVKGFSRVEVDFVANNPGSTLFHCHQNLHMDFGFMRLFEYT
jgi:FtsP/CotA-like multicopper oxidase with cupredoxin domain